MFFPNGLLKHDMAPHFTSTADRAFHGHRILVVEDEQMIAVLLEDMLADLGCKVVGPVADVAQALNAIGTTPKISAAVLDVNLRGKRSDAIADALESKNIPFLFLTGYDRSGLCEAHRDKPVLRKPFNPEALSATLALVLAGGPQAVL